MTITRAHIPNLIKPGRGKKYCPWRDKGPAPIVIRRKARRKRGNKKV